MSDSGVKDEREMMRLICRTLRAVGQPLSRLELSQALEPEVVPELRLYIEKMLKLGILRLRMTGAVGTTTVNRYEVADGIDCDSIEAD